MQSSTQSQLGFWLWREGAWVEVTRAEYVRAERNAGFHGKLGEPVTAGFSNPNLCLWGTTLRVVTRHPPVGAFE